MFTVEPLTETLAKLTGEVTAGVAGATVVDAVVMVDGMSAPRRSLIQ